MALAIFDLDNTLIAGDSDHGWGQYLVDKGIVDEVLFKEANDRFYQQYLDGTLDILEYSEFSLGTLSQYSKAELDQWHQQFMAEVISPIQLPKARALIDQHRDKGDLLMIITATNQFVTEPIAKDFGIEVLLATVPEFINDQYTGRVDGIPCFQSGKIDRLNQWLEDQHHDLKGSYFYSDSHNDLPLLDIVDNPVAVDPDEKLQAIAESRQWPIISLRE